MSDSMLEDVSIDTVTENQGLDDGLYVHVRRAGWGVAILAWERGDKRAYQFEDGGLRVFKRGFFGLFEEIDPPDMDTEQMVEVLTQRLEDSTEMRLKREAHKPLTPLYSFETQLQIFTTLYPEGFEGAAWRKEKRGEGAGRRLKRHRDSAIEQARDMLSKERLDGLMAAGQASQIIKDAVTVMKQTDLVSNTDSKPLMTLDEAQVQVVAQALLAMLHGEEGRFLGRFDGWVQALRKICGARPGWRLATVLPALVMPDKEVCVRQSSFKNQAGSIAPNRVYTQRARRKPYRGFRKVARTVRQRLIEAGHAPKDMLDVHDFIHATLKPSARKAIED
jgi:hypothetical protein